MKVQNVIRGGVYIVALAVAVLFYVQSQKAVARLAVLTNPSAGAVSSVPAPNPTPDPQAVAARQYEQMARQESAQQAARIKAAMDAEAAKINAEIAARPIPTPVTGWASRGVVRGRVYSNANLTVGRTPPKAPVDVQGARLVVETNPKYGVDQLRRASDDKRLNCAAFSYRPTPGVTRNRLYCAQAGK